MTKYFLFFFWFFLPPHPLRDQRTTLPNVFMLFSCQSNRRIIRDGSESLLRIQIHDRYKHTKKHSAQSPHRKSYWPHFCRCQHFTKDLSGEKRMQNNKNREKERSCLLCCHCWKQNFLFSFLPSLLSSCVFAQSKARQKMLLHKSKK